MFDDFSLIQLVRNIAEEARRLTRLAMREGRGLQAADAVHVASARALGVEVLYTTDTRLLSLCNRLGLQRASLPSILNPYLPGMSPSHDPG